MVNESMLRKVSFVAHGGQGLCIFITFILLLVLKGQKGESPGQVNFMFALCFITPVAIIFAAMSPRFDRTRKFANPIVLFVLGALFTIFWFAAFIAIAIVNAKGIREGEAKRKDPKKDPGGCAATSIGSPRMCELSKGAIGLGVVIFLLFCVSTGIAGYIVQYLHKNHYPWDYFQTRAHPSHTIADIEATTNDAFSHKMDGGDAYGAADDMSQGGSTQYAPLHGHNAPIGGSGGNGNDNVVNQQPYQRYDYEDDDADISYGGAGAVNQGPYRPPQQGGGNPSEPVNFPSGPY